METTFQTILFEHAYAEVFGFDNGSDVKEYHVMVHAESPTMDCDAQVGAVCDALRCVRATAAEGAKTVFKRYFLSDAANQAAAVNRCDDGEGACSIIQQAPLDGTKIALWAYLLTNVETAKNDDFIEVSHGAFRHLWCASCHTEEGDAYAQTRQLLDRYVAQLGQRGCRLADHAIRTWFFVNDIDLNYGGLVKARNDVFDQQGLTRATHYVASTGIAGRQERPRVLVQMDAYAIAGIGREQVGYLYAPTHLNRTSDYGVSFERGTMVNYADRRHVFISGTASIDNRGQIVHAGNIVKQAARMIENVETLLREGGASFADVGAIIVYLRDVADYRVVREVCTERFPDKPLVIVNAAVCRPGWLVEMECMAAVKQEVQGLPHF